MNTGERIQKLRKSIGISQEELGDKIGVSRQAISKWESNQSMPSLDNLVLLASIYNISVDELLGIEQDIDGSIVGGDNTGDNIGDKALGDNTGDNIGDNALGDNIGDNTDDKALDGNTGDNIGDNALGDDTGDIIGDKALGGNTGDNIGDNALGGNTGDNTGDNALGDNTGDIIGDKALGDNTGDNNKIKNSNLTLIALILQASLLNICLHPILAEESLHNLFLWLVKLIPLFTCSIWTTHNLKFETNQQQYLKNIKIELLYNIVQSTVFLISLRMDWIFLGGSLIFFILLAYIYIINPTYMNRTLYNKTK